ncbi:MAG: hypothetical protein U0X58_00415 [Flavobacteriaceae bacterium]
MKQPSLYLKTLLFLILSLKMLGQEIKRKNYFPIWTYHQRNINVNGLALGIGSFNYSDKITNTHTNGIKVELIGAGIILPLIPNSPIVSNDSLYDKMLHEPLNERINGISLSAAGTACDCAINGINLGVIGHATRSVNGISAALFGNISQKFNGIQMSLFNETYAMSGLQLGLANSSEKFNGIQIGLINNTRKLNGIQMGLWNVNQKRKFPIINWNFGT